MSAIMRRRRSLIGLSRIEGSCPEVGVLELPILRTGRPRRHPLSISWLARSLPLAPLPRERVRSMTHKRQSAHIGGKGRGKTAALVHSAGLTLRGNTGVFSRNDRGGKFNHGLGMSLREEPGYAPGLQY